MTERINSAAKDLKELPKPKDKTKLISINVAQNNITNIDVINDYPSLTQLNVRNNDISSIPTLSIALQSLDVSGNPISTLDPVLSSTSLVDLTISQCHNISFTFALSKLVNLTSLCAIANKLRSVDFLDGCTKLQSLNLSNNLLEMVPSAIGHCSALTSLNLCDNNISHGLHSVGKLKNLVELNLSWNQIKELKKSFYTLSNLTQLLLYNNLITRIHKNIKGLENLVELNLKNNYELKTIHSDICHLKKLSQITLDGCYKLKTVPSLKECESLKEFIMNNAALQQVPELPLGCTVTVDYNCVSEFTNDLSESDCFNAPFNLLKKLPDLKNTKINRINVCSNSISSFDFAGVNLLALNISYNQLDGGVLPKDITALTKLRQFSCSCCGIKTLPENLLDHFKNIEQFECSFNPIEKVTFTQASNLQQFVMQFCELKTLPNALANCNKLKVLDVSNNHINQLFEDKKLSFEKFTALSVLDVSYNNLKTIGDVDTLKSLIELNISYNPIQKVDKIIAAFSNMPKLADFICKNIPVKKVIGKIPEKVSVTTEKTEDFKEFKVINTVKQRGPETNVKPFDMIGLDPVRVQQEISIGSYEFIGKRTSQQDSLLTGHNFFGGNQHLICVFDGHGGDYGSCFISNTMRTVFEKMRGKQIDFDTYKKLVVDGIAECNKQMEQRKFTDGATSVMVSVNKTHYFIANIGDSRCVLIRKNGGCAKPTKTVQLKKKKDLGEREKDNLKITFKEREDRNGAPNPVDIIECGDDIVTRALSCDHKPNVMSERLAIRTSGNYVNNLEKVNGYIAVSRAIGDVQCKKYLSSTPDFFMEERNKDDCYLVMACDGVWDVLGNDDVARIVMNNQHLKPDCIAKLIVDLAYTRLSGDNISCIVFDCRE